MSKKKRVLIVDDDVFVLNILEAALKSADYEAIKCQDGEHASELIKENHYDAIITDIVMPKKNGIEFVNHLRRMNIQIPVIAISADEEGHKADEQLDFGCYFADDVLKKPVPKDKLLNLLNQAIGY